MTPQQRNNRRDNHEDMSDGVTVPKWMLTLFCAVSGVLAGCAVGWVASLESRVNSHAIHAAEIRTRQVSQQESLNDLKATMDKLTDKVDQLPTVLRSIGEDLVRKHEAK